ncbi:MAG: hypothetical protein JJU33_06290 [Phycisphaerales bacterium]|nr:hypothetical protein [Phycisphaerales bacterium]
MPFRDENIRERSRFRSLAQAASADPEAWRGDALRKIDPALQAIPFPLDGERLEERLDGLVLQAGPNLACGPSSRYEGYWPLGSTPRSLSPRWKRRKQNNDLYFVLPQRQFVAVSVCIVFGMMLAAFLIDYLAGPIRMETGRDDGPALFAFAFLGFGALCLGSCWYYFAARVKYVCSSSGLARVACKLPLRRERLYEILPQDAAFVFAPVCLVRRRQASGQERFYYRIGLFVVADGRPIMPIAVHASAWRVVEAARSMPESVGGPANFYLTYQLLVPETSLARR